MVEWLLLALMGLIAGTYGTIVGAGGGFIVGPLLITLFKEDPRIAVGTTLTVVLINGVFGTLAYARQRRIDFRSGVLFGLAATPGSIIGARILSAVPGDIFRVLFGLLLLGLVALLAIRPPLESARPANPVKPRRLEARRRVVTASGETFEYHFDAGLAGALNVVLGFISSFFGVGGGFLRTPALVYVFNFPVQIATATSIFALSIYTAAGAATHMALGNVSFFPILLFTGAGVVLGSQIGAVLSRRLSGPLILRALALALGLLGVQLILQGVGF